MSRKFRVLNSELILEEIVEPTDPVEPPVDPIEPPVDPVEPPPVDPDPPTEPPEPTEPTDWTWEKLRANDFADWPTPPSRDGVFRFVPEALSYQGSVRISIGRTTPNWNLHTFLDFIQVKGSAANATVLSSFNWANDRKTPDGQSVADIWKGRLPAFGGTLDDATTWPLHKPTDADIQAFKLKSFGKGYTQIHALQLPDGSILYGNQRQWDSGNTSWRTGRDPWIGRVLPDGTIQTLALPGFDPQQFGGGFALVGNYVYLGRGGYHSGQPESGGVDMLRVRLTDLLNWLDTGRAPTGFEHSVEVLSDFAWGVNADPSRIHHRPFDVVDEIGWTPPPTDKTAYWSVEAVTGNPIPVPGGMMWFVDNADHISYPPNYVLQENKLPRALVFDSADYDRVRRGELDPSAIRGTWHGVHSVFPRNINPNCGSYDPATRTLFVAHNDPTDSWSAAVSAFEVL